MKLREYFYDEFPRELQLVLLRTPSDALSCGHCGVPAERRALVKHQEPLEPGFALCWWGLTLLDQGLHSYFPEQYERWLRATGGYPIPVTYAGFGCVRTVSPRSLLENYTRADPRGSLFASFLDFYVPELRERFPAQAGLSAEVFFEEIRADRHFGPLENECLRQLGAPARDGILR